VITSEVGRGAHWLCPRNCCQTCCYLSADIPRAGDSYEQVLYSRNHCVSESEVSPPSQVGVELSRDIQPRGHPYSVFEDLILLGYNTLSNDSYRRFGVACCLHNQSPRSQLFFLSWRIREAKVFADMEIHLSF
jgi:hypothetical protein